MRRSDREILNFRMNFIFFRFERGGRFGKKKICMSVSHGHGLPSGVFFFFEPYAPDLGLSGACLHGRPHQILSFVYSFRASSEIHGRRSTSRWVLFGRYFTPSVRETYISDKDFFSHLIVEVCMVQMSCRCRADHRIISKDRDRRSSTTPSKVTKMKMALISTLVEDGIVYIVYITIFLDYTVKQILYRIIENLFRNSFTYTCITTGSF